MYKRPIVLIALIYIVLIIILKPLMVVPQRTPGFQKKKQMPIISQINNKLVYVVSQSVPKPYDSLLTSIVFGSSMSSLDSDLRDKYRKVGLSHLLVASGTQVSILIGVCLSVIKFFKIPMYFGVFIAFIINTLFVFMAGCGISILRAYIMGVIILFGLLLNKDSDIYTSLAIAALIMIIFNPSVVFDLGFQLSFAATWALVYLCPILEGKGIPSIISVSLAPIMATLPIVVYNFNQISIAALPVNILVIPWIEIITILGFISIIFGAFSLIFAKILSFPLVLILRILNWIVCFFPGFNFSCLYIKQPNILVLIGYYISLIYITEKLKSNQRIIIKKEKVFIFLFLCVLVWNFAFGQNLLFAQNKLQVSIIDVGQGDSIFIKTPIGKTMLIDGGAKFKTGDAGRKFVLPLLRREGINKIDVVVLTHPHNDHVGGFPSILKELSCGLVLDSGQIHTGKSYMDFLKIVNLKKIPYRLARSGGEINLGENVCAQVLHPTDEFIGESSLNNNSIVIRLTYKNFSMMFMGDTEKEGETAILSRYPMKYLRADFLKVGHHGSKTGSSVKFLDVVKPKMAFISAGRKNKFHHPHPSTIKRLQEICAQIYRTDLNGNITILTDGKSFKVLSSRYRI